MAAEELDWYLYTHPHGHGDQRGLRMPRDMRNRVWVREFGSETAQGKCFVCQRPLFKFHAILRPYNTNKSSRYTAKQLKPICRTCEKYRGPKSVKELKQDFDHHTLEMPHSHFREILEKIFHGEQP